MRELRKVRELSRETHQQHQVVALIRGFAQARPFLVASFEVKVDAGSPCQIDWDRQQVSAIERVCRRACEMECCADLGLSDQDCSKPCSSRNVTPHVSTADKADEGREVRISGRGSRLGCHCDGNAGARGINGENVGDIHAVWGNRDVERIP